MERKNVCDGQALTQCFTRWQSVFPGALPSRKLINPDCFTRGPASALSPQVNACGKGSAILKPHMHIHTNMQTHTL